VPSSLISPALEKLEDLPAGDRALLAGRCPSLAGHLAGVPDPRDPRGVRHTLTSLLLAAVAAVLAGARSFTAIGEWAADAPPRVLAARAARKADPGRNPDLAHEPVVLICPGLGSVAWDPGRAPPPKPKTTGHRKPHGLVPP